MHSANPSLIPYLIRLSLVADLNASHISYLIRMVADLNQCDGCHQSRNFMVEKVRLDVFCSHFSGFLPPLKVPEKHVWMYSVHISLVSYLLWKFLRKPGYIPSVCKYIFASAHQCNANLRESMELDAMCQHVPSCLRFHTRDLCELAQEQTIMYHKSS